MADSVNATGLPKILLLLFLLGLSRLVPVTHAQTPVYATYASPAPLTTSNPPSHTPFTDFESAYATSTTTDTYTPWAICATEGAPWMIDPPTATRLVELFCDDLYQPANFPVQGDSFRSNEYPTDLTAHATTSNTPTTDYTAIERSGIITLFSLSRGGPLTFNNITHMSGTPEQCSVDNQTSACRTGLGHAINKCQRNSHGFGGFGFWETSCGFYSIFVQNCTDNWVDPNCERWHRKWSESDGTSA